MITLSFNYCIKSNDRYCMRFGSLSFSYSLLIKKAWLEAMPWEFV